MRRRIGGYIAIFGMLASLAGGSFGVWSTRAEEPPLWRAGVARADVTPEGPIRLTGYASRGTPSTGVVQRLWAKALALQDPASNRVVLVTLDVCGVSEETYREFCRRLQSSAGIAPGQVALCVSHTHSGPATTQWAPNIFAKDIPPDHLDVIDRHTRRMLDGMVRAARQALDSMQPAAIDFAQTTVGFARNRRAIRGGHMQIGENAGGPVEHSLPVLRVSRPDGSRLALAANYACHCTTLGGDFNQVCGDWAGFAQEAIEQAYPGAVGMITIGCGADSNPSPRGGTDSGLALARQHGRSLCEAVQAISGAEWKSVHGPLKSAHREIRLPFAKHFTPEEWRQRAEKPGIVGYHARKNIARIERGETLPTHLSYPIVSWSLGSDLTLVFLSGEVVGDYARALKRQLDPSRLWVSGYANYVPCYIPSKRILAEGGYEAEDSMWYYDRPARLTPESEDLILGAACDLVPAEFHSKP